MTTDDKIIKALGTIISLAKKLKLEYLIFGSCGIQSYLDNFFRLPNDIDFVLRANEIFLFLESCKENNYKIIEEQGRYKVYIDGFPIHVIPEIFSVINKEDKSVIAKIDFSAAFDYASMNKFSLLLAQEEIKGMVMPLDYTVFMELVRKQDTNSLYSLAAIMNLPSLPIEKIYMLFGKYPQLLLRIKKSLELFSQTILAENSLFKELKTINLNFNEIVKRIDNLYGN